MFKNFNYINDTIGWLFLFVSHTNLPVGKQWQFFVIVGNPLPVTLYISAVINLGKKYKKDQKLSSNYLLNYCPFIIN